MKTALVCLSLLAAFTLAPSAQAGRRVSVYVGGGYGYGCAPRVYAAPVCYVPRRTYYYAPRTVYYRPAPVYYVPAPRFYQPCAVGTASFGWRR